MNRFFKELLEINDISFKYYLAILLILAVLNVWQQDFVFERLHFPLSWLFWFVVVCGLIKLLFNQDKVVCWVSSIHSFSLTLFNRTREIRFNGKKQAERLSKCFNILRQGAELVVKNINFIFSSALISYLLLLLIKEFKETLLMQRYLLFNKSPIAWMAGDKINWLLGFVILTGILWAMFGEEKKIRPVSKKCGIRDYVLVAALGMLGAYLIYYKTKGLGTLSFLVSGVSGLLIVMMSLIILNEDDEEYKD